MINNTEKESRCSTNTLFKKKDFYNTQKRKRKGIRRKDIIYSLFLTKYIEL